MSAICAALPRPPAVPPRWPESAWAPHAWVLPRAASTVSPPVAHRTAPTRPRRSSPRLVRLTHEHSEIQAGADRDRRRIEAGDPNVIVETWPPGRTPPRLAHRLMPAFAARWVDHAREQRGSLPVNPRARLDEMLHQLLRDPRIGTCDKRTDQWTTSYDRGRGVILYTIEGRWLTLTVLRVLWLG
ncbi:hypothetical protein [Frankia sp. AgB32]|uniref:hypothetical protein n=1 Tax=Frankia sp. AgB32 TaxID=631119 RepID=UPI00200FD37C|nr:hypothetical protein [Frankia sp. AgB32]MCK9893692.1 hypothetical protein [Frankia sp. AgB32]